LTKHLQDVASKAHATTDAGAPEVEITAAMVDVGARELREHPFGSNLGEVVKAVYFAMEFERRDGLLGKSASLPNEG
jgi:hypothetical protein